MAYHFIAHIKRNPSLTIDQFNKHWSEVHAQKFMGNPVAQRLVVKYTQSHFDAAANAELASQGFPIQQEYDGIVHLWFRSIEDARELFTSKHQLEVFHPDEEYLLDLSKVSLVVTRDEDKWEDGKAPEGSHVTV